MGWHGMVKSNEETSSALFCMWQSLQVFVHQTNTARRASWASLGGFATTSQMHALCVLHTSKDSAVAQQLWDGFKGLLSCPHLQHNGPTIKVDCGKQGVLLLASQQGSGSRCTSQVAKDLLPVIQNKTALSSLLHV